MAAWQGCCEVHCVCSVRPDKLNSSMNSTSLSLFLSSDHPSITQGTILNLNRVDSKSQVQLGRAQQEV